MLTNRIPHPKALVRIPMTIGPYWSPQLRTARQQLTTSKVDGKAPGELAIVASARSDEFGHCKEDRVGKITKYGTDRLQECEKHSQSIAYSYTLLSDQPSIRGSAGELETNEVENGSKRIVTKMKHR